VFREAVPLLLRAQRAVRKQQAIKVWGALLLLRFAGAIGSRLAAAGTNAILDGPTACFTRRASTRLAHLFTPLKRHY
jgi:hypothetical protein